jgi:hypothetical protein
MAKAKISMADGTEITIEGDPSEVAAIVQKVSGFAVSSGHNQAGQQKRTPKEKRLRSSPTDLILSLADGGFFKTPKDLAAIKEGLAEIGHIYAVQTLSSILFKMVRRRYLRRVKEDGRWVYIR